MLLAGFGIGLKEPFFLPQNFTTLERESVSGGVRVLRKQDMRLRLEQPFTNAPNDFIAWEYSDDLRLVQASLNKAELDEEILRVDIRWAKSGDLHVPVEYESIKRRGTRRETMVFKRISGKINVPIDAKYFDTEWLNIPAGTPRIEFKIPSRRRTN